MQRRHDFKWFEVRWLPRYGWIVDRPPAAVVVPETRDGRLWLAKVRRVPAGTATWELPGGEVGPRETPVEAALRELYEECGLVARDGARALRTTYQAAPGMGLMPHHVVVARGVEPERGRARPQREEGVERVRTASRADVARWLARGEINVFATLAGLAVAGWLGAPPAP